MSEGTLVRSEDLEGDFSKSKMKALERENYEGDQEREGWNSSWRLTR